MKIRRIITWTLVPLVGVALLITGFRLRYPPDPYKLPHEVLDSAFEQWKLANNTNGYPNVEGDSKRSFALAGGYLKDGGREYKETYGYVPGLKEDDPPDLILMYLKEKTRRTYYADLSGSILRKPKWMVITHTFAGTLPENGELVDTPHFRARLQKTLDFLKENKRPYWENIVKEHAGFLNAIQ
jgi:hypothetical protein